MRFISVNLFFNNFIVLKFLSLNFSPVNVDFLDLSSISGTGTGFGNLKVEIASGSDFSETVF